MAENVTGQGTLWNLPNYAGDLFTADPVNTPFLTAIGGLTGGMQTEDFEGVDVADLQRQLGEEKAGRKKDRQEWNLRAVLAGAGCTDVDYLLYKLGDTVEYEEDGSVKNQDALLESCRKDYAAQFPAQQAMGTGGAGNFARNHGDSDPRRAQLEKDATDTNLSLAQRIYAREQLAAMDNRKDE